MRQSKGLALGIVAAVLVWGGGDSLLAKTKHARRAAAPARPSGVASAPDASVAGSLKVDTIKEYTNELGQTVYEISASQFDISPPLRDLAATAAPSQTTEIEPSINPLLPPWRGIHSDLPDPVVQIVPSATQSFASGGVTPAAPSTGFNFDGVPTTGATPSDSNGTVGYDGTIAQYVETVNTRYEVWNLNHATNTATVAAGPTSINTLWSGFGGACQTQNSGDPIVLYDKVANRWLISQFTSSSPYFQCVAVSTTSNATGSYARWAFAVPSPYFGDYPHIATWTDAYYMMAHAFSGSTYGGAFFAAMDRAKMLAGNAGATWQVILDPSEGGHMPADLDGFAPPPTNAPGIFLSWHTTGMVIYRMKVDWVTPANTVKTVQATVPVAAASGACLAAATAGTCIPQPGTTALLDSLGDRLMFRAAYRNFIDHESLVISHSVDPSVTGLVSGVRWYDFRLSGQPDAVCASYPCLHQQGTVADAANGRNRWMPSVAMDGAENMLVAYSTSGKTSGSENQSIRYTGRAKGDTLGQMTVAETTPITGTANYTAASRWGDYSSMAVDPFDDCTFWYVNEYLTTTSSWKTRVFSSTYPAGSGNGQCQPSACLARPASAPTIGSASTSGANQIAVTWTGIAPTPGGYAIERAVGACGSEGLYQPLAAVAGTAGNFTDTTVQGGYTYSYRVIAATDAAGKCQSLSASGCVSATATGNCSLKPVFTGVASGSSNNSATCGVNLSWTAAASSCPLTPTMRYSIFRGTTPDFTPSVANRIATCVTGPASYLDQSNVTSGVTYYYVVRAEDGSTGNGGECGGGNEDANSVVASGTAFGSGTQASPGTWTDGGGDGTAFLKLNVADLGDTADQAWRFVSTATDAGANHTSGGAYAYRNTGPASGTIYLPNVCAEMQSPGLTVGATTLNLQYWERHQLEYHWDGIAVEYQVNGLDWNDVPTPSNSTALGCATTDILTGWEALSCTGTTPANACGYPATKVAYTGPLGTGTSCTNWATSATVTAYAHRCHQITGLTPGDTIKFRWRFSSDPGADYGGFYLDDIAVTNIRLPNSCSSNPCLGQPDGTSCNDGNACTQSDTCQSGVCTGSNPVVCTASDPCHVAGTCNTVTGVCSNPNATNGTACNDGNACTQTDTCQTGVCTGSNPVVCTASDACHIAGTCNTATGACSNPNAANGTACNDGNACTSGDTCQSGTCTSGTPAVCTASDPCHIAGTCNPGTGLCSNPSAANGTACSDGNACTQSDTCQSGVCTGSNPVVCSASDPCHVAGTCNTSTGLCTKPNATNGTTCSVGNACTQTDTCHSGVCTGSNPVVCAASDACHVAGTCDTATGVCSNPTATDGAACNDGNACTQTDTCQGGVCAGSNPVVCTASNACHVAGTCDTATGVCSNPNAANGTACSDSNACTQTDTCQGGVCAGSNPVVCAASNQCHVAGTCNPFTGTCSNPNAANGTSCDDGNACTVGDTCGNGSCNPGTTITAPPETLDVTASADKATFSWSTVTSATQYDVVRGSVSGFPVGPGGGDESCFDNLAGAMLVDATVPDAGSGFWYLSRGENACGIGTFGTQSDGTPRTTTTCP